MKSLIAALGVAWPLEPRCRLGELVRAMAGWCREVPLLGEAASPARNRSRTANPRPKSN